MSESNKAKPLRVGLLGLGTVGQALVGLTRSQAHSGVVEIIAASVRDPAKPRPGTDGITLVTDPTVVASDRSLPIIVELMGGADAPLPYVLAALNRGATIVTANKAMLAAHAGELLAAAAAGGGDLLFEGAVAGGIPIVRLLREALTSDPVTALYGIINGTSNFILSEMTQTGREFGDVLREAQAKGYAEADPTLDVGGGDARQKLALLCALAFGALPVEAEIPCRGIDGITPGDIDYARDKGYRIKLVGFARRLKDAGVGTQIETWVAPALLPDTSLLSQVGDAYNAIVVETPSLGRQLYFGRGAGGGPTAHAVMADLLDAARNVALGQRRRILPLSAGAEPPMTTFVGPDEVAARFSLRFTAKDQAGVLHQISGALGAENISIESMVQPGGDGRSKDTALIHIMTHATTEAHVRRALAKIEALDVIVGPCGYLRVLAPVA